MVDMPMMVAEYILYGKLKHTCAGGPWVCMCVDRIHTITAIVTCFNAACSRSSSMAIEALHL